MNLLRSTPIYFFGNIIEKGLAFLLIPLYTHYLSTTDYGILTILQSIIAILVVFFGLSLNGAASRFHIDGNAMFRKYHYGNIFMYVTLFSLLGSVIFYILGYKVLTYFNIPIFPYILLIIFIAYLNNIYSLYQLKLQMEQRAVEFVINNIVKVIITTSLIILLVIFFHKKANGVLEGTLIGLLILYIYIIYKLFHGEVKFNINKKIFNKNFKYSIYLIPHNIAGLLNSFLDRFFITGLISISQAGVYALGSQISIILSIFAVSLNRALTPVILKAFKQKNYSYLISLSNITISFIIIIALFLSLFSSEIIDIVSPSNYSEAKYIIPILTTYYIFQMYYFIVVGVLFYVQKATKYVAVGTLTSLGLNFIFNYFFIKLWGIEGAAFATLLSMIIVTYIVIFIANKFIKIEFEHFKIHCLIIIEFFIGSLSNIINIYFLSKVILFLIFILIILYLEKDNPLLFKIKEQFYEKFYKKFN